MKKKQLFLWAILLIIFIALLQIPLNLEYFMIKQVNVHNNSIIPSVTIMEKSNYIIKRNIFGFGKRRLRKSLLKIPQFNDIIIKRKFPDTIDIDVIEKKPWLNLLLGDTNVIIDLDGTILNTTGTNPIDPSTIPVVRGLPATTIIQGKIDIATLNMLKGTLATLISLFKPEQLQLNLDDPNNIEILADDILLIKVGNQLNITQKRAVLKTFLAHIKNKWNQVEYIDIKSIKCPVIKFKENPETLKVAE